MDKSDLETRIEKLEKGKSNLDRQEFILCVCITVLTILESCVFIAETIAIGIGIVSKLNQ